MEQSQQTRKIPVGISSCLLGDSVRFNGGHKHSRFCTTVLSPYFEFQAYCPEVAIGMGVPREPIRLVGDWEAPRAVGVKAAQEDFTDALEAYGENVGASLGDGSSAVSGYILMKDSPSCGLYSTKVYNEKGGVLGKREGVYTHKLRALNPLLPMEEEGRLNDPVLRENFIARVFLYDDWRNLKARGLSARALVEFHSRYKFFSMAYSQSLYRELGRMVAQAGEGDVDDLGCQYIDRFMRGTQHAPSRRGHVNVLYHLVGYLKQSVPGGIRQDLMQSIEDYRLKVVPLAVPMKLMQHYLDNYAGDYVRSQTYLNPYPYELGLRNAI